MKRPAAVLATGRPLRPRDAEVLGSHQGNGGANLNGIRRRGSRKHPRPPVPLANKFLRTEVTWSAPADGMSISVKCHRPTRPVTTGASDRRRNCIGGIGHVAGLNDVSRAVRIGYGTAHNSAGHHTRSDADTDSTTPTARFGRRRCQQGNCNRRSSSKCEQGLVHGRLRIDLGGADRPQWPPAQTKSRF
jgi:hypothetical protein